MYMAALSETPGSWKWFCKPALRDIVYFLLLIHSGTIDKHFVIHESTSYWISLFCTKSLRVLSIKALLIQCNALNAFILFANFDLICFNLCRVISTCSVRCINSCIRCEDRGVRNQRPQHSLRDQRKARYERFTLQTFIEFVGCVWVRNWGVPILSAYQEDVCETQPVLYHVHSLLHCFPPQTARSLGGVWRSG